MSHYARLLWTGLLLCVVLGLCEDLSRKDDSQDRELRKPEPALLQAGMLPDLQGVPTLPVSIHFSSDHSGTPGIQVTEPERFLYATAKLTYVRMHSEYLTYKPCLLLRTGSQLRKRAFTEYPDAG